VSVWTQIMEARTPGFCAAHGIVPPAHVDNAAVRWGLAFEGEVIRLAAQARNARITHREQFVMVPRVGLTTVPVTAHLDGIYHTGELHEGKTTTLYSWRDNWGEPGTDRIPRDYAVQVQHQQLAARACGACPGDRTILTVLCWPGRPDEWEAAGAVASEVDARAWADVLAAMGLVHQYEVGADLELQARLVEIYRQWWADYVVRETPPPPDGYDDIKRLIPAPRGTVIADEQTARLCAEYGQINDELARIERRKKQLAGMILAPLVGGAERPIDDDSVEALVLRDGTGRKLASYTKTKRGALTFRCGG
jgi:hypothetical protein